MERSARMRRLSARFLLGMSVLVAAGCARRPAIPPPPPIRPIAGYVARLDSLESVDPRALAGKRVVLDPGHGGHFRGSLGVGGLTEAQVNLAVALELERLLAARGAQVFFTRRDDRDFLSQQDSSLRADLTERVRIANAYRPDLFVSIHHNADPAGAHDKNETQTYYKLGDEGPSLDAAASIHRFLKRNLGIERQRLLPGNYFVLRNSEAPALLTEASYLTHPEVEAQLVRPEKQRLEAEALYLGIAHFFSRGAPVIETFAALGTNGEADTAFADLDAPALIARVTGAFDRVALELNGEPLEPLRIGDRIEWRPQRPLAPGRHEARLQVALSGVGAARERRVAFRLERRPSVLRAGLLGAGSALVGARIEVLDRAGLWSHDSLRIRVRAARPGVSPAETVVVARDGVAWAYLRLAPAARRAPGSLAVASALDRGSVAAAAITLPRGLGDPAPWTGWLARMPGGGPLREAPGTREPTPAIRWITRDGFAALERDTSGVALPLLEGFRPTRGDGLPAPLVAVAGAVLHRRRLVLDPDGGGEESGGMGPSGTRAALYNMEVARALASFLTAAGADVRLSRTGDYAASDVERVRINEAFGAERYLRIGHRAEPAHVGYYFSSAVGRAWGERTATWLARFGFPQLPVRENAQYPLQQTSCPALYVATRRVDQAEDEEAMNAPGAARREAYALYLALIEEWAGAKRWPLDSLAVDDEAARPLPAPRFILGGALVLEGDSLGRVRFARTESGPLPVRVEHPAIGARTLLLDSRGVDD